MKYWKVALSGGGFDGRVVEMENLGARACVDLKLWPNGHTTFSTYDYTGVVARQRVAFARYSGECGR